MTSDSAPPAGRRGDTPPAGRRGAAPARPARARQGSAPAPFTAEEIARVRRPFRGASLLPGRAYHDGAIHDWELEQWFARDW
ncbi:MAG: hypothetical protein ACYDAK_11240, partial [Candidatus Limnocylindrales bacterium]